MKKREWKNLLILLLAIMVIALPINVCAATVRLNTASVKLIKGQTYQLKMVGTNKKIKWSSSKKSVAKVTSKGKVKALKKGTVTITAKVSDKKYTCRVQVYNTLTKQQALKAVRNYCDKRPHLWYDYSHMTQKGNYYYVWIRFSTGAYYKYAVNKKTGVVKSYAPYWSRFGMTFSNMPVTMQEKFNALNYL